MPHDRLPDPEAILTIERARNAGAGCIGVFDSGVGGLSVLRELRARLPSASFVYVGDTAWSPYGTRDAADVVARSVRVVAHLVRWQARLIVVACNTASVTALDALRGAWPELRFVGVEPGIKPAAALTRSGRIGVMATAATVASERVRRLVERHAAGKFVHLQPCTGLAEAIERGAGAGEPPLSTELHRHCAALRRAEVDTVVLGCTHYPLIAPQIRRLLGPGIGVIDTSAAVARQVALLWDAGVGAGPGSLALQATGPTGQMLKMSRHHLALEGHAVALVEV